MIDSPGPVLRSGELWRVKDLLAALGANVRTFARWEAAGLRVMRPGTRNVYVRSDDVMEIMAIPPDELPVYEPKYKRNEST